MTPSDVDVRSGRVVWPPAYGWTDSPCEVLAANLDGSVWVMIASTAPWCVPAAQLAGAGPLPAPANPHRLTPFQIGVLTDFAIAGISGLADFEHHPNDHTKLGEARRTKVAEARRVLISHGLVAQRARLHRSDDATTGHVWHITRAGRTALCQPCPVPYDVD